MVITAGFFALLLVLTPLLFEGKLIDLVKRTANNNINATLDFKDADLSLIRNFPNLRLQLEDFYILNKAPFSGDTLVSAKKIDLYFRLKVYLMCFRANSNEQFSGRK